jgi:hypothetical protein
MGVFRSLRLGRILEFLKLQILITQEHGATSMEQVKVLQEFVVQEVSFICQETIRTFKSACGPGTNIRVELYAIWLLLKLALERGVSSLQVLGDSKLVIDWAQGKSSLENLILLPLMEKFREV